MAGGPDSSPEWHQAVLIDNGKVAALGNAEEMQRSHSHARKIDLNGARVFPGFADAHLHMAVGGRSLSSLDLNGGEWDTVSKLLLDTSGSDRGYLGPWIVAFNWDSYRCDLSADLLDRLLPGTPIVIHTRDLHSCCCSTEALRIAGIDRKTSNPPGGSISRDEMSNPTGRLYESAKTLLDSFVPKPEREANHRFIIRAQEYLLSLGLTAVSEVIEHEHEDIYRQLDRNGELKIEIDGWRRIEHWDGITSPPDPGNRLQINTLKVFLDGAFGSHTAALFSPYNDLPDRSGVLFYVSEELQSLLRKAVDAGWRLAIHAIGDRAVSQAISALKELPVLETGPHRIEHLQLLPEDGIDALSDLSVVASVQPVHFLDDRNWLAGRIGAERCERSFKWRSLANAGITLAFGSDWPVASPDPLQNIHTAINRCGFNEIPDLAFLSGEAVDPINSIRSTTHGWAVASGTTNRRGVIAPGMDADFTVVSGLSEDLVDWSDSRVEMTICQGEVVYAVCPGMLSLRGTK